MWRTAFDVLGKQRTSFPSQILHRGQLISNPKEIASAVNVFFIDKIGKLKEEVEHNDGSDNLAVAELKTYLSKKNVPRGGFDLRELEKDEVRELLKKLKGKKSSGLDWICGLKIISQLLMEELTSMINISIRCRKVCIKMEMCKSSPCM